MSETVEKNEGELSFGQKLAGNIVAGAMTLLCGVFLLLCGLNVIPLKIWDVALPSCLMAVGVTLLVTAAIGKNPVSLWLSWVFDTPAVISLLAAYTPLTYVQLYPFYIAIPAIASLFTLVMTPKSFKSHLKVILFFGVIAFLFTLNSLMGVSWSVVLPLLLVLAGLLIIAVAVFAFKPVKRDRK
ncbi:MAG: hypothetical protein HFK08_06480 [Clostridia bacterium]|jgi:hypothetical protein|nr:hypothetical protein [Clostridia bacterium]